MSDITPDTPAAEAPPADPPVSAPAVETEEIDLDSELTEETFSRDYVQKLRQEAAARRTAAKEWESKHKALYDGFDDPSDVDYLIDLARKLQDDPLTTAAEFEAIAKRVRDAMGGETPPPATEPEADDDRPLTKKDLERIEFERAQEHALKAIKAEATSLGYAEGTAEFAQLIWVANNDKDAGRDLQKAHAKILGNLETVKQAAIQEYIESVRAGNAEFPALSAPSGGAPAGSPNGGPPTTFKDASASALARLEKMV
jgi:hypothetical protein